MSIMVQGSAGRRFNAIHRVSNLLPFSWGRTYFTSEIRRHASSTPPDLHSTTQCHFLHTHTRTTYTYTCVIALHGWKKVETHKRDPMHPLAHFTTYYTRAKYCIILYNARHKALSRTARAAYPQQSRELPLRVAKPRPRFREQGMMRL